MNYSLLNHGVCMLVLWKDDLSHTTRVWVRLLRRREVVKRVPLLSVHTVHGLIPEIQGLEGGIVSVGRRRWYSDSTAWNPFPSLKLWFRILRTGSSSAAPSQPMH